MDCELAFQRWKPVSWPHLQLRIRPANQMQVLASKHPVVRVKTAVSHFVEFLGSRPVISIVGSLGVGRSAGDFIRAAFSQVVRMLWGC